MDADTISSRSTLRAWRRGVTALLAFLALALGSAVPHDVAAERVGAGSKVEIAESAIHPHEPAHFEDAEIKVHPACVACLLHVAQRITVGHSPLSLPLARDASVPTLVEVAPSAGVSLSGPARAPPVASPSA